MSEPLRTGEASISTTFEKRSNHPFARIAPGTTPVALDFSEKPTRYEKISRAHGRNMTESPSSKRVVWTGEYPGDIFGAKTIKGVNMSYAHLEEGENGDYDVRAQGLTDDVDLPRLQKGSEFLRKRGLPTEAVRAISDLSSVWVKDPKTQEWDEVAIEKWEEGEMERVKTQRPDLYDDFKTYLKETKFVVIERDIQVDERIRDIEITCKENKLRNLMAPIFKWLNVAVSARNAGIISGTPEPERFDDTQESYERYFQSYLPSQIGIYLGRVHKLGVVHRSPHDQNWSAIGTLYDADTIYGKPIFSDDASPTAIDIEKDLWISMDAIDSLAKSLILTDEFKGMDLDSLESQEIYNFTKNYLLARFGKVDSRGIDLIESLSQIDGLDKAAKMLRAELSI